MMKIERAAWKGRTYGLLAVSMLLAACSILHDGASDDPDATGGPGGSTEGSATDGGQEAGDTPASGTWELGGPFAVAPPPFAKATHSVAPSARWGASKAPYPTNAAWEDLVLGTGAQPFQVYPYAVKALQDGVQVSAPKKLAQANAVLSVFTSDVTLGSVEALGEHVLAEHDALSVTVRWDAPSGASLTAPFVRGMPYATAKYDKLTPKIGSVHAITAVNGASTSPVTADRFVIEMNSGQTWVLYASSPLSLTWSTGGGLTAGAAFTGSIRVAIVSKASDLPILDAHRGAIPTGGKVSATVTGDEARVGFTWTREGQGPLAMATLPHHRQVLEGAAALDMTVSTLRGPMTLIAGDAWTLREPLSKITWAAPRPPRADRVAEVKKTLAEDAKVLPAADDPYFFGKQVARLGRLALIADELGEPTIATETRARMKAALEPWLTGKNESPLVYDQTWGGVCSTKGLADPGADFGNGRYNDHHFHYGYFLYAAAVIGKEDGAWLTAHEPAILALARDVANPSPLDTYFTPTRHMDWFEGHSWAAGLFEFGDGRNQESTSEAVNAYYGLQLLGLARGDANMTNVARVLLALELRGARTYWQIKSGSEIYEEPFASHKVVGVLWGAKVDHTTFFGANLEFIHGIQMLPFTPITEELLPAAWVSEEYPLLAPLATGAEPGWRGFIYMDHAVVAPDQAWTELQSLSAWDDGNSRTNALYWAATRPAP